MTDLYELLNRAIDSQPDTPEARLAVYNHIRGLYDRRRQEIDPSLPESAVQEELARLLRDQAALETVIARIEAERSGAPPPGEELLSFDRFMADNAPAVPADHEVPPLAAAQPATDPGRGRPRVAARRQPADGSSSRRGIALAAIAVVLAGIGGVAWWLRNDGPVSDAEEEQVIVEAPTENDTKIADRVSGAPPEDPPQTEAAPAGAASAVPAGQPATLNAATDGPADILAQRAFLFELDEQNPEQPAISAGQAVWRLEGKGTASAALQAEVTVPEAGLSFSLVIRPNDDASLPASHTIDVTFANAADKPERVVRDMAVPQLRVDREPRGAPLAGLMIPVADNVFLVGLSSVPSDVSSNYSLLRDRDWVDVPVRFVNGKIGTITFAKGSAGHQAISDAIDSWR